MWLHFTSDYNSEGNQQTEHTNQTLEQYFYTYNNASSATTSIFLFFTNRKYHLIS